MVKSNNPSSPNIVKPTVRPPELIQLVDADNQTVMETRNDEIYEGRIYLFDSHDNSVEQIAKFHGPDPPEWRSAASVAYFKDKLYYLGGKDPETGNYTNQVDLLVDGIMAKYIDYQTMNRNGLKLERFQNNEWILELHR
ncbi:hypothetical protein WR25_11967 [Diploscapter pachys]|uniref:Uncharacterized protein n=1 Tax=Diploscapter pachys TaxID=2018661 RepID=A0A2A2L9Z1_9BILA|nr:hypothetical protein WR25_11967 [Diploscapter pachys]